MSALFGGKSKSRDIAEIVNALREGTSAICNESVSNGNNVSSIEIDNMAEDIKKVMVEHYSSVLSDDWAADMLAEDANNAAMMFKNNIAEFNSGLTETASMPSLVTLTASIATTMRTPYEATFHRLFDTRTVDKQIVDLEEVIPTVRAPGSTEDEDLIDALAPYAAVPFVDRTEILVDKLTDGVELNEGHCKSLALFTGMNPLFKVNRDARVVKVDIELDGEPVDQSKIRFARGTIPYFGAKDNTLNVVFEVLNKDDQWTAVDLSARMDFDKGVLVSVNADPCIKKVYFYATVSHAEHTHPIYTSFRNNFTEFVIPTRPHIEVSLPQETRTDIQNSIQHFANVDIITAMTENITVISSRMEDQRLKKCIDSGHVFEGEFSFEAPANFAYGNLEWVKREFIPFLDQAALRLKNEYNITDCHFRCAVSPFILRILDTDYSIDKAMTEEGRGSGVINYSIGVKTSTSTFYFISSQAMDDNMIKMLLIPNNFKNSQVKTYNYFKYSSFLTDQMRRSDNHTQPAVVYSERNLPIVFTPLSAELQITELPVMKTNGPRYIRRAS